MLIFVYGTLKKGFGNHPVLGMNARFVNTGRTCHYYVMYDAGFPVVMKGEKGAPITGEIYDVDQETIKRLDRLESVGYMYRRERVVLDIPGWEKNTYAEMYIGLPENWQNLRNFPLDKNGCYTYER